MPLAEHDLRVDYDPIVHIVSIHVPLAEHDFMHHADLSVFFYVSIHVPLAEHDPLSPSAMFG